MVEPATARRAGYGLLFVGLAALVAFWQILPFRVTGPAVPGPAVLPILAFAWVIRRPDLIPPVLVGVVMLFADILFMRPLGLDAALTVLATEYLRGRARFWRDLPFAIEWFTVAIVLAAMTITRTALLAVTGVAQPGFAPLAMHLAVTILCYPLAVIVSVTLFGIRRGPAAAQAP